MSDDLKPAARRSGANATKCSACSKPLPAGRKHRKYCNAGCRFKGWRAARGIDAKACTYCGVVAGTVDHVPARSVRQVLRAHVRYGVYPELEVPCCHECNSALGARGFTLAARRVLAREAIERRYHDVLRMPRWTDDDLAELGAGLGQDVKEYVVLQRWVLERLSWSR